MKRPKSLAQVRPLHENEDGKDKDNENGPDKRGDKRSRRSGHDNKKGAVSQTRTEELTRRLSADWLV